MREDVSDSIVERIQKLRRLSRSSNQHEAALAAAKMQELLFAHNLSLGALQDPSEYIEVEHRLQSRAWARLLLAALCRNNFCKPLLSSMGGWMYVVGRRENVAAVNEIFDFLCREVDRLCKAQLKVYQTRVEGGRTEHGRSWSAAFRNGAASTIAGRLDQQRQLDVQRLETTVVNWQPATAIIRRLDLELEDEVKRRYPALGRVRRRWTEVTSLAGYRAGQAAGTSVALRPNTGYLH